MTRRPSVTEPKGRSEPSVSDVDPAAGIDYDMAPGLGAVDDDEITIGIVPHRLSNSDKASSPAHAKVDRRRSHDVA